MPRGVAESHQLRGPEVPDLASLRPAPARHSPCVMDLISMVLGMRSSEVGCTDFRLILDLKRVLIKVDFPKPLCPGERTGLFGVALQRGQVTGLRCSDAWASPPSTPWLGVGQGEVRRQEGAWVVAELSQCVVAEQDTDPSPSDHRDGQTAPCEVLGCPGGAEMQNGVGEAKCGAGPSSADPLLAVGHTGIDMGFEGKALQSPPPWDLRMEGLHPPGPGCPHCGAPVQSPGGRAARLPGSSRLKSWHTQHTQPAAT